MHWCFSYLWIFPQVPLIILPTPGPPLPWWWCELISRAHPDLSAIGPRLARLHKLDWYWHMSWCHVLHLGEYLNLLASLIVNLFQLNIFLNKIFLLNVFLLHRFLNYIFLLKHFQLIIFLLNIFLNNTFLSIYSQTIHSYSIYSFSIYWWSPPWWSNAARPPWQKLQSGLETSKLKVSNQTNIFLLKKII